MKIKFLLLLWLCAVSIASAQFDTLFIKTSNDTLKLYNLNIDWSCGAKFEVTTELSGDSIIVTETDTSTQHMTCGCYYDVIVALSNLQTGTYTVYLYRGGLNGNKKFVDSLTFSVANNNGVTGKLLGRSTSCHKNITNPSNPDGVTEEFRNISYLLLAAYPNPFNPSTNIQYEIPERSNVRLDIFSLDGKLINMLVNENKPAGRHSVMFNSSGLSSGVYFCRIQVGSNVLMNKLMLLK